MQPDPRKLASAGKPPRKRSASRAEPSSSKPWTQPSWMTPYVSLIGNTGGWITPEHAMNCDGRNCNVEVNGPRALLCTAVSSQVALLERLHARDELARLDD